MSITGALRVRNEARWIERVIASILPLCDRVAVFNDHSDDSTGYLCASMPKTTVYDSPFAGLNEARDKSYLLDKVRQGSDWILWIDGDEILTTESVPVLKDLAASSSNLCASLRIRYLWNDEKTVRVDGVYGDFRRQSMFRPGKAQFEARGAGPNFHIGSVPRALWSSCAYPEAVLLHTGYMLKEDRLRKYQFYNRTDPNNEREGRYQHMVIGDLFPADSKFKHGGPLVLKPL